LWLCYHCVFMCSWASSLLLKIKNKINYYYYYYAVVNSLAIQIKFRRLWRLQVYIDVVDINDNSPYFVPDTRTIQLSELSAAGTAVLLPSSRDDDTTANSVTSYQLRGVDVDQDEGLFSLTMSTKLDGSTDVKLTLVRALDREVRDTHRLVVSAFDGGQPRRSGTLNVIVKVLDANDNRFAVRDIFVTILTIISIVSLSSPPRRSCDHAV